MKRNSKNQKNKNKEWKLQTSMKEQLEKKPWTMDPEGRTPPSRRLTWFWEDWKSNKQKDTLFQWSKILNISWPWRLSKNLNNRESPGANPSSSSSSECYGWWTRSWWDNSWQQKDKSTIASSQKLEYLWWSARGGHQTEGVRNAVTAQNAVLSLHTTSPVEFQYLSVKTLAFVFQPTVVQVSALCLRHTDILDTLWVALCYRLT